MRKRRAVIDKDTGDTLGLSCWGCGFWPIRLSWMTPCVRCNQPVCRICTEKDTCECSLHHFPEGPPATNGADRATGQG